jgi:hypothetical protein
MRRPALAAQQHIGLMWEARRASSLKTGAWEIAWPAKNSAG